MAKKFLVPIDLNENELQNVILQNLATAPSSLEGKIYFNTADSSFYGYNGTSWKKLDSTAINSISDIGDVTITSIVNGEFLVWETDKWINKTPTEAGVQIRSEKNANNGYAGLDASGKIGISLLPDSVMGQLTYKGILDASTGTYPSGPNTGDYYVLNTAGTINTVDYEIGDWAVYNGATWDRIDNSDKVSSVAGKTGAVTLDKADVGLGNVDNTSDINKPVSSATQAALNGKSDTGHGHSASDISDFDTEVGNNTTVVAKTDKYAETIGNGTLTEFTINHNLGSEDVITEVKKITAPKGTVITDVEPVDTNNIKIKVAVAPANNELRVTCIG